MGLSWAFHEIPEDLRVECSAVRISLVLMSLLHNAFDAIKSQENKWVMIEVVSTATDVVVSIVDSGPGVPVEIRVKIMEPMFSTKPPGKGAGLGLSIAQQIIKEHHGKLYLDPNAEHTAFRFQLPLIQPK